MNPVQKALWFVEAHSRDQISLEDIASACHVSPFHLTRAFAGTTGFSVIRYLRGRRLTEAARRLSMGRDDILNIAIDVGYGSHEAFTRAFVEHFKCTPESVRKQGHTNNLQMMEAITMKTTMDHKLETPRFEILKPMTLSGIVQRHDCEAPAEIPNQWQKFGPYIGSIPGQVGNVAYGVVYNVDQDNFFDYMCAVETKKSAELPQGFTSIQLLEQKYVVFTHRGHIAGIRSTLAAIWGKWFPESGHETVGAPLFERYGSDFDIKTGMGNVEIWIPIKT